MFACLNAKRENHTVDVDLLGVEKRDMRARLKPIAGFGSCLLVYLGRGRDIYSLNIICDTNTQNRTVDRPL